MDIVRLRELYRGIRMPLGDFKPTGQLGGASELAFKLLMPHMFLCKVSQRLCYTALPTGIMKLVGRCFSYCWVIRWTLRQGLKLNNQNETHMMCRISHVGFFGLSMV